MQIKYAKDTVALRAGGQRYAIHRGEAWAADSPVVLEHPEQFSEEPIVVRGVADNGEVINVAERIEEATARPGEQRNVRRPKR